MRLVNRSGVWYAVGRIRGHLYRTTTGVRAINGEPAPAEALERMKAIEADIRCAILMRSVVGPLGPFEEKRPDGFVYFIATPDGRFVKIGWTADVNRRLRAIQHAHPGRVQLLAQVVGSKKVEADWHRRFAGLRQMGEWFRIEGELLEALYQLNPRLRS